MGLIRRHSRPQFLYTLIKSLLNKKLAVDPLVGPNGMVYSSNEKTELLVGILDVTFTPNIGIDIPKISTSLLEIQKSTISLHFTTPAIIHKIIKSQQFRKAPSVDHFLYIALKHLPPKIIVFLNNIFNRCLLQEYFSQISLKAIIITIQML